MSWSDEGARNLDNLLKAHRTTNAAVARALGVDNSLVSRWRSGDRVPDADHLLAVLKMVGGSADAVLGLAGVAAPVEAYPPHLVERVMKEAQRLELAARQLQLAAAQVPKKKR